MFSECYNKQSSKLSGNVSNTWQACDMKNGHFVNDTHENARFPRVSTETVACHLNEYLNNKRDIYRNWSSYQPENLSHKLKNMKGRLSLS